MPNGKNIEYKTNQETVKSRNKKTKSMGYQTFFQTEEYHIVHGKNEGEKDNYQILRNSIEYQNNQFKGAFRGRNI